MPVEAGEPGDVRESLQAEIVVEMGVDVVGDGVEVALVLIRPHRSGRIPMDRWVEPSGA